MSFASQTTNEQTSGVLDVSDKTLRGFVGYQTKRTFNVIQADLNETLSAFDLRMVSFSVLVMIIDNNGIRQSQIADALSIEAPNLVVALDGLERRDLIIRERLATDRRVWLIQATLAGRRLCEKAVRAVQKHERQILGDTDAQSLVTLMEVLKKIEIAGGSKL